MLDNGSNRILVSAVKMAIICLYFALFIVLFCFFFSGPLN